MQNAAAARDDTSSVFQCGKTETIPDTRCQRWGNLIAGTKTTLSTTRELSAPRGHPHRRHKDDLIANTGTVNFVADISSITDIANFNFTGFAGWHRLHHDGGIAETADIHLK